MDGKYEEDVSILLLEKGKEKYLFIFSESNKQKTLDVLKRYAGNQDLSFDDENEETMRDAIEQELPELEYNRITRLS